MATCLKCLHHEICNSCEELMLTVDNTFELIYQHGVEKSCKHFKDKDSVIMPPCNVGDTVYYIDGKTIVKNIVHCISVGGRHGEKTKGQIHIYDGDKEPITVNFDKYGKKVFPTYAQAVKALQESEA